METFKFKKVNLMINIPLISIFFILFFSAIFITDKFAVYYIGIIVRIILGIWCIFNGIWNSSTDYYSLLKSKWFVKNKETPIWGWWLLIVLGIICLVTASMGYGFNNVEKPL